MAEPNETTDGVSRRGFLKRTAFGLGGSVAVLSFLGGKSLFSRKRKQVADFPEDSIFAPAKRHQTRI
jgi:hypothetical protein